MSGEQQRHLLGAEHHEQAFGHGDARHAMAEATPAQRNVEEEPERTRRDGTAFRWIAKEA